jgi:bacillithiol system protein YtxJ
MFNFELYRTTILPRRINRQNVGKITLLQDISTGCMEIKKIRLISFKRKMGIFNNLFSSKNTNSEEQKDQLKWIPLTSVDQLIEIEQNSSKRPQIIFKHSTTCGISSMVLRSFKSSYCLEENQADLYFLDLHRYREVSNEAANKFQVYHQSPQVLIIKNGIAVAHESHGGITSLNLSSYI